MKTNLAILAGASLAALAGAGALAQPRPGGYGTATYWMSAETSSGLAAMAGASPTRWGRVDGPRPRRRWLRQ